MIERIMQDTAVPKRTEERNFRLLVYAVIQKKYWTILVNTLA